MDRKQRLNRMPAICLLADFVLGGVARNINTSHNYWYLEGFPLLMKKIILRSFRPTPNNYTNSVSICIGLEEPTQKNYFICNQRLVLFLSRLVPTCSQSSLYPRRPPRLLQLNPI